MPIWNLLISLCFCTSNGFTGNQRPRTRWDPELSEKGVDWVEIMGDALAVIVAMLVVGHPLRRLVFRRVARFGTPDLHLQPNIGLLCFARSL